MPPRSNASMLRLVTVTLNEPRMTRRAKGPAEMVAAGESMLLGYTTAFYLDESVVQSEKNLVGAIFGTQEPRTFGHPAFQVAGPDGAGDYTVTVTDEGTHDFSWEIELPPLATPIGQGVSAWVSGYHPANSVRANLRSARYGIGNLPISDEMLLSNLTERARVVIRPMPDAYSFDLHIRAHEYQHVRDHQALAKALFGPLDRWLRTAKTKAIRFVGNDAANIKGHVGKAKNYTTGDLRLVRYWIKCCEETGDLFHATQIGGPPSLQYVGTSYGNGFATGTVMLHVSAAQLMRVMPQGPHGSFFNLRALGHEIDGNEPKLRADGGAEPGLNDRVIESDDMESLGHAAAVQVRIAEQEPIVFFGVEGF